MDSQVIEKKEAFEHFVRQYEELRPLYETYTESIAGLLKTLLSQKSEIDVQNIVSRTKDVESFRRKITDPTKSYTDPLKELTDISGVRVIVYYKDDIPKIEKLLSTEFDVDPDATENKADDLQTDKVGYQTVNIVVSINKKRASLPEWSPMEGLKCEIQVRTVLQDGWAAISHKLLYKDKHALPKSFIRRLNLQSGALEIVDDQFSGIRYDYNKLVTKVTDTSADDLLSLGINTVTLTEYLSRAHNPQRLFKTALEIGFELGPRLDAGYVGSINDLNWACDVADVQALVTLDQLLIDSENIYPDYLSDIFAGETNTWIVSLPFLTQLIVCLTHVDKFKPEDLVGRGWHNDIANRVLNSAGKFASSL